jgi:hypothetical protein
MEINKDGAAWRSDHKHVDIYMQNVDHPLIDVIKELRKIILNTDKQIGEHINWSTLSFFYKGSLKSCHPKVEERYVIVFNLFRKDCIRIVFPNGAKINDTSGLLEGDYNDGRRLVSFYCLEDVRSKEPLMQTAIKKWLELVD